MMQAIFVIAAIVMGYGVFRLNDRRHKSEALQNIAALQLALKEVTAKCMQNPNGSCLSKIKLATEAEFWASFYLMGERFAKAESEAEFGLQLAQQAHEALIFSKPEFRVLATGCSGR